MLYVFLNSKFGGAVLQAVIGALLGLVLVVFGVVLGRVFSNEAYVVANMFGTFIGFFLVVITLLVFIYFMPRIYINLIPIKLCFILFSVALLVYLFDKMILEKWSSEFYPALAANPAFLVSCLICLLVFGVLSLALYFAYVRLRREAASRVTSARQA